jgi:hypothetical protein
MRAYTSVNPHTDYTTPNIPHIPPIANNKNAYLGWHWLPQANDSVTRDTAKWRSGYPEGCNCNEPPTMRVA